MKYLTVQSIRTPWWGAWKKYGWEKGTWGVGIKRSDIMQAIAEYKTIKIPIQYWKKAFYVDPKIALDYGGEDQRGNIRLIVIPSNKLTDAPKNINRNPAE